MDTLILEKKLSSLFPFTSSDLPQFTIITEKNGSGKTQLLEGISHRDVRIASDDNIYQFQLNGLDISSFGQYVSWADIPGWGDEFYFDGISISGQNSSWQRIRSQLLRYLVELGPEVSVNDNTNKSYLSTDANYLNLIKRLHYNYTDADDFSDTEIEKMPISLSQEKQILTLYANKETINRVKSLFEIEKFYPEERNKYSKMVKNFFSENSINSNLFNTQLTFLFNAYLKRRLNNFLYFYLKKTGLEKIQLAVSDEEFVKQNRPPWEVMNDILLDCNMDFEFESYNLEDYNSDATLEVKLKKKSQSAYVSPKSLSSGEKVIMGLILCIFHLDIHTGNIEYPQLVLLDEPDAHLHPEITKLMIDVLQKSFVEKLKIKVIITTHSPTTVALAPDDNCIFELKNGPETELKNIGKDCALKLLTGFLPTLSIDYKNHRQVFVESPSDVDYYQTLYEVHSQIVGNKLMHQLYFIPSGGSKSGRGNSSQVYDLVKNLKHSGCETCFGIVDRDKNNKQHGNVLVHGIEERYSIESFLFDPVYVFAYLLKKKYNFIYDKFALHKTYTYDKLKDEPEEKLQTFIDYFFELFSEKVHGYKKMTEMATLEFFNGKKLQVPKLYMEEQGHDGLIPKLNKAFGEIFPDKDGIPLASELKSEMVLIIGSFYPFVPKSSIDLIEVLTGTK